MDLLKEILRIQAVNLQRKNISLSNIHKEILAESTEKQILETEINLIEADYQLEGIKNEK